MDKSLRIRGVRSTVLALSFVAVLLATPGSAQMARYVAADGTLVVTNAIVDLPAADLVPVPVDTTRYAAEIRAAASRWQLPEELVAAVVRVESNFDARAVSPKGAQGLMQLMPQTAAQLGVTNVFDPRENIDGGVRHLRSLLDRFGQELPLALAAYNAGEQAVLRYQGIPPFQETQAYVARILTLLRWTDGDTEGNGSALYRAIEADGTLVYSNRPLRSGQGDPPR